MRVLTFNLMGSFNSKQLKKIRSFCIRRDQGKFCVLCNMPITDEVGDVHHIDGNKKHNPKDGSNWGLAHHSCNVSEAWVRKRLSVVDNLEKDVPFTFKVSTKMELQWIRWMLDQLQQNKKISWDKALNVGALEIDGSQETVKRYLKKHLSDPDNPKSLFKTEHDHLYNTMIVLTDHVQEYFNKHTSMK